MMRRKIFGILCFLQIQRHIYCFTATRHFSKNFNIVTTDKAVSFGNVEICTDSNRIHVAWVECNRYNDECNVTQKTYPFNDHQSVEYSIGSRSCRIRINYNDNLVFTATRVIPLGHTGLVMDLRHRFERTEYWKRNERQVYLVHMTNCADRISHFKITDASEPLALVVRRPGDEDFFDIFYMEFQQCDGGRGRLDYGSNVRRTYGLRCIVDNLPGTQNPLPKIGMDIVPISEDQLFVLERIGDAWVAYAVWYNNFVVQQKEAIRLFRGEHKGVSFPRYRVSTAQGRVSFCWLEDYSSKVQCSFVSSDFEALNELTLNFPHDVRFLEVYNLPDGGFLTLTNQDQARDLVGIVESREYELTRFSTDGSFVDKMSHVPGLCCAVGMGKTRAIISELSNDEICISFRCDGIRQEVYFGQFETTCLAL